MIIFLDAERIRRRPGLFRIDKGELLVLKFGTNSLTRAGAGEFGENPNWLYGETLCRIAGLTSFLYEEGIKPVIVSSGAVAAGMMENKLDERPKDTGYLQDLSLEGAIYLANLYKDRFKMYGIGVEYLPVTWHCFATRSERENIRRRVESSWARRKIMVFNTNDGLTNEELASTAAPYGGISALFFHMRRLMGKHPVSKYFGEGFYENDILAEKVARFISADALVFFSNYGDMGTGGGETKRIAIRRAQQAGIRCAVYGIDDLESVFGLSRNELSTRETQIYRAQQKFK